MDILKYIKKHPAAAYFTLTFAISWTGFIIAVGGPNGFPGNPQQFETQLPYVAAAMLLGPSTASILLTALTQGKTGLRQLLTPLLKWKINIRWYAAAILPAPLIAATILYALTQPTAIAAADDKTALIISGIIAGLTTVLEEIGWTGFATPRLRQKHSIIKTGIIIGILWGLWHLLQGLWVSGTYAGTVNPTLFIPLSILAGTAQLTAYRILLVWVNDRTKSLLLVTLMHASLTTTTVFILRPLATGTDYLTYAWLLAAALWAAVAATAKSGQLTQK